MCEMTTTVYKFNELPEIIKEKVLDKQRNINTDNEWYEFTLDEWKTKLSEKGFTDAEIFFSGFCSQGDGACFDARCDVSNLAAAVYSGKDEDFYREVLQLFADNGPLVLARIEKNSYGYHYSHANTRYIYVDKEMSDIENDIQKILMTDLTQIPAIISEYEGIDSTLSGLVALRLKYQAQSIDLNDLLNKFERDADELRKNLSNAIYKELEQEYDGLISDESVIETLKCNDYEFDEDGDII